ERELGTSRRAASRADVQRGCHRAGRLVDDADVLDDQVRVLRSADSDATCGGTRVDDVRRRRSHRDGSNADDFVGCHAGASLHHRGISEQPWLLRYRHANSSTMMSPMVPAPPVFPDVLTLIAPPPPAPLP